MKTTDNWHLSLTDDQRHDLHSLLDFVSELSEAPHRYGNYASALAVDVLDSLVTITSDDPK